MTSLIEAEFRGSLGSLVERLSSVVPPAQEGSFTDYIIDWKSPRIILGREDAEIHRVHFHMGQGLSPRTSVGILSHLSPGDCLVLLEPPLDGTHLQGPRGAWFLNLLFAIRERGAALLWMGNTWEAWEKGPARVVAEHLRSTLPVSGFEPIGGFLEEPAYKVVVFVPEGHEDAVRDAMSRAGAGHIGNYSHCTFQAPGQGTFLPLEGTHPYLGDVGKLEKASEFRLETIVRHRKLKKVIEAMLDVHPYEEVAYDVYRLENGSLLLGSVLGVRLSQKVPGSSVKTALTRARDAQKEAGTWDTDQPGQGETAAEEPHMMNRIAVSRFLAPLEIEAALKFGGDILLYLEDTYQGHIWAERLGIQRIKVGRWVYNRVLAALKESL